MGLMLAHVAKHLQARIYKLVTDSGQMIALRNSQGVKPAQQLYLDINLGYSAIIPVDNQTLQGGQVRAKLYGKIDAQIEADDNFVDNEVLYKVIGVNTPHNLWKEALLYAVQ